MQDYHFCDAIHSFGQDPTIGTIYLGDYTSSKNKRFHRQNNILTVVTAGLGMKVSVSEPCKHKLYPLYDCPSQNIERFFHHSYSFLEEALKYGNVLIHCYAGVSRSCTLVCSYLMKKLGWSFKQSLEYVRKKRWVVNPNPGFVRQLKSYQSKLAKGLDNPESQKVEESNPFTKTFKKTETTYKNNSSIYTSKPTGVRGVSVADVKARTRLGGYSLMKK